MPSSTGVFGMRAASARWRRLYTSSGEPSSIHTD